MEIHPHDHIDQSVFVGLSLSCLTVRDLQKVAYLTIQSCTRHSVHSFPVLIVLQESLYISPIHWTPLMWDGVGGCGGLTPCGEGVVLQAQCQHS